MGILQNFCKHKWESHNKYEEHPVLKRIVEGTEMYAEPILEEVKNTFITEVLICNKCGKIEIIEY